MAFFLSKGGIVMLELLVISLKAVTVGVMVFIEVGILLLCLYGLLHLIFALIKK